MSKATKIFLRNILNGISHIGTEFLCWIIWDYENHVLDLYLSLGYGGCIRTFGQFLLFLIFINFYCEESNYHAIDVKIMLKRRLIFNILKKVGLDKDIYKMYILWHQHMELRLQNITKYLLGVSKATKLREGFYRYCSS